MPYAIGETNIFLFFLKNSQIQSEVYTFNQRISRKY